MKAVILAGGGGTRLWPLSTEDCPKQFQKLVSNKTMIEETINRLDFLKPKDIYVAINEKHLKLVQKLCPKIPKENIIIEPALRDTASCIGLAATIIEQKHPNEVMCIIYADHLLKEKKSLQNKLKLAEKIAKEENTLNIIEIVAKTPDTGYGYVKIGKLWKKIENTEVYYLNRFVEKPDLETAKKFVKSGNYLWNTGIYVWKAKTLLDHYKRLQPDSYQKFMQIMKDLGTNKEKSTIQKFYPTLEKISIDYAIMEKVDPKQVRILKADLGWSDIGNFEAIWKELVKTKTSNITRGEVKSLDCQGCLIYADNKKKIAALGLKDLIVVDTKEGLLICKKSDAKRIKELQK